MPPHREQIIPKIRMKLVGNVTKKDDPVTILTTALKTIDTYPLDWIHIYTDVSANRVTSMAGYGVYFEYPGGSYGELSKVCEENGSNYDTDIAAIKEALDLLITQVQAHPENKQNIVFFIDAMATLLSL